MNAWPVSWSRAGDIAWLKAWAAERTVRYRAADAALQAEYQAVLWWDLLD